MEQHQIPRQITSFEFKLIGFMTLKQFLYLIIFVLLAVTVYFIFPIPLLNILLAIAIGIFGLLLAFVPINDRPFDVTLRNLWRRLNSPTQYFFKKANPPIAIFNDLFFDTDPHKIMAHVDSQKKLAAYLATTKQTLKNNPQKQNVQRLVQTPTNTLQQGYSPRSAAVNIRQQQAGAQKVTNTITTSTTTTVEKKPYFIGMVKNNRKIPLPGILIYVKDINNNPVRLLKTNPHGVFATYNPLTSGEYVFEMKDPKSLYFFDTMKIRVEENNPKPIEFYSKEML